MLLTPEELKHVVNVDWGLRFWRWFRWILLLVLIVGATGKYTGWMKPAALPWLIAGGVYLLVAWPGLCRAYVYTALRRVIDEDPEARAQLKQAISGRRERS